MLLTHAVNMSSNMSSVTLVTCVVVAEVTFSAVMVSGDVTGSFSWIPALTCSPFIRGEVRCTQQDCILDPYLAYAPVMQSPYILTGEPFCFRAAGVSRVPTTS